MEHPVRPLPFNHVRDQTAAWSPDPHRSDCAMLPSPEHDLEPDILDEWQQTRWNRPVFDQAVRDVVEVSSFKGGRPGIERHSSRALRDGHHPKGNFGKGVDASRIPEHHGRSSTS